MLEIEVSSDAKKFLKKLPSKQGKQIARKMLDLCDNPLPNDSKKLKNSTYFRADAGEYRIIYFFDKKILHVILIGKRNDGEVYKQMQRKKH